MSNSEESTITVLKMTSNDESFGFRQGVKKIGG